MGTYTYSGTASHIYQVTVATTGTYDIVAYGGSGGNDLDHGSTGGFGAEIGDQVMLQAGEKLEIVVGGAGINGAASGGGGGGTFVLANTGAGGAYVPLIVAGGGGGGSGGSGSSYNGGAASYANAAVNSSARGSAGTYRFGGGGGGGAGFKASGQSGGGGPTYAGGSGGSKGPTYSGGGGGGGGGLIGGSGGFGGGGGGGGGNGFGSGGGGGGGGYSGGNGGTAYRSASGGGTSFDSAGTPTIAKDALAAGQNGDGFVTITPSVACYVTGTLIRTKRGDVAVEDLTIGDIAVTASGAHRPIVWVGHRTMDCRRHPRPREAQPVRIAAHAFAPNRPVRDLVVSPAHAICVDIVGEVLVPAQALVNGATIRQLDVEVVTYWHVELDSHDIVLAENLPAESYLDCGNRAFFSEDGVVPLHASPDAPALGTDDYCRPFQAEGALVNLVQDRLRERARTLGWRQSGDQLGDGRLAGLVLEVDGTLLAPTVEGLVARARLPAGARDVRIRSASAVPADCGCGHDPRRLGLPLASLAIDDGHGRREIACTDPRLVAGFHPHEHTHRWTGGLASLPAELWAGCRDGFDLHLAFSGPALPQWIAPGEATTCLTEAEAA